MHHKAIIAELAKVASELAGCAAKLAHLAESLDKEPAPSPPMPDKWKQAPAYLTTKETAELLGCSTAALERWRGNGGGPKFIRIGNRIRYPLSELPKPE